MSKLFVVNLGSGVDIMDAATGAVTHEETEKEAVIKGGFTTVLSGSEKQCSVQIPGAAILDYFNDVLDGDYNTFNATITQNNTIIISPAHTSDD